MSYENDNLNECFECGSLVDYEDNFCANCGAQLIEKERVIVKEEGIYFLEQLSKDKR
jgi:rRNA maturation endonuclease Nob1